jgi:hypothetical protein
VPNNWIVEIVETDVFGWTPRLEEAREFTSRIEAKRFYEGYKRKKGIQDPTNFLIARPPYEKKPLQDKNKVDPLTSSDPDED